MKNLLPLILLLAGLRSYGESILFKHNLSYLYDEKNIIENPSQLKDSFQKFPANDHFGLQTGSYWILLELKNESESNRTYILQIPTHNVSEVVLYDHKSKKLLAKSDSISPLTLSERFPTFKFEVPYNSSRSYLLNTFFQQDTNFPVKIYNEEDFHPMIVRHTFWSGLYYGFLLCVLIFNLFFFFKFRDSVYLFYVLFLMSYTLAMLYYDGVFRPLSIQDLETATHLIIEITMFLFSFKFLNIDEHLPHLKKYAVAMVGLMAGFEIIYLISDNYLFFALADVTAMCSFFFMWMIGIFLYRKVKFSPFYVAGYLILIVCGYYYVLSYNFGTFYITARTGFFKIASTIDMLVFTYAIIYRMDLMAKENSEIIKKLRSFLSRHHASYISITTEDPFDILLKENALSSQPLSRREIEVLRYIYQGVPNADIADKLFISKNTVKYHIRNIYKKLDVTSRDETSEKINQILYQD